MANTFELISSVTVGLLGQTSIAFTSIPSTYTDLSLSFSLRGSQIGGGRDQLNIALNSSSASFTGRALYGEDGGTGSGTYTTRVAYFDGDGNTANTFGSGNLYFPNYAGSTNKSISSDSVTENNSSATYDLWMYATLWSNTAAITSITLTPNNGPNFMQYSTAYLYGVKNA